MGDDLGTSLAAFFGSMGQMGPPDGWAFLGLKPSMFHQESGEIRTTEQK